MIAPWRPISVSSLWWLVLEEVTFHLVCAVFCDGLLIPSGTSETQPRSKHLFQPVCGVQCSQSYTPSAVACTQLNRSPSIFLHSAVHLPARLLCQLELVCHLVQLQLHAHLVQLRGLHSIHSLEL